MPAAAAALGLPGFDDVLDLPTAGGVCVLLIDGLGARALGAHAATAPFLTGLGGGRTLTAGFPSTTATSLGSLGTGLPPGTHGLLGYRVRDPASGTLLNLLRWDGPVDPRAWQPRPTVFERVARLGTPVFHVARGAFDGSGLTAAGMRGTTYVPADDADALVAGIAASTRVPGSLTFAYHGDVDHVGHGHGCGSPAWRAALADTDRLVERVTAALPAGVLLLVTADHGMVDVPESGRVDLDARPEMRAGVALVGGEARARHVYAVPGAASDVADAWRDVLGDRAWVLPRAEAVAAGWFGPFLPELAPRVGDVVVAMATTDGAVVATRTEPRESALVGMHGSLTAEELLVPLLLAGGPADG
jgi:hypothetical protein